MSANFNRRIFISATTFLFLAPPWAAAQLYTAGTSPAPRGGYPYDSNIGVTPAMAIIFICIVVIFFLMGCISVYARRCIDDGTTVASDGVAVGRRTRPSEGLDFAVIESFPTFIYSEVKGLKIGKGTLECAVCLNEFEDEEMLRLLPKCSHVFHPDCIDAWLSSNITCPVCRAILVPTPDDPDNFILPVSVSETLDDIDSPRHPNSDHDTDEHDMIIDILSPETVNNIQTPKQFFPPRSASRKVRFTDKFRRSFTTGHVLIRPGDDRERFTLRLSEEARSQLVNSSLSRTKSGVTFPRARSLRKGYRSASAGTNRGRSLFNYERFDRDGRLDRWVFTRTPSVFSRAGSVRSPNWASGDARSDDHVAAAPKNLLRSVKSPFHRLFGTADSSSSNNKGDVDVGERSFSRLRLDDGQV